MLLFQEYSHKSRIHPLYKIRGGDARLAEDITQETFLRSLENNRWQIAGYALAYLYTVARNLCIDEYRKRSTRGSMEELTRLIPVPATLRFLSQLWDYLPANLLYAEGFFDMRLVSVFGVHFTIWQFAPFVYIVVIALLALLGRRVYCRYQVNGR